MGAIGTNTAPWSGRQRLQTLKPSQAPVGREDLPRVPAPRNRDGETETKDKRQKSRLDDAAELTGQ